MKKLIILIIIVAVLVGGYFAVSNVAKVRLDMLEGKKEVVRRGDLEVPITASGNIKPASVTKIKGKASGEILQIPFELGQMVKQGDLIVLIDPKDEQLNVDRLTAERDRAKIALEHAKLARDKAKLVGEKLAEANVKKAEAYYLRAKTDYEERAPSTQPSSDKYKTYSDYEWNITVSNFIEAEAGLDAARTEPIQAELAVRMAEEEVKSAEQAVETAEKTLEDAKERLKETKVYSPIEGMILARPVQVGEVVQSGKTSFMGGDILMEIADVSEIYAVVNVDEADIGLVRELAPLSARPGPTATNMADPPNTQLATLPAGVIDQGQEVEVTVESFPEESFTGVIERISPQSEVIHAIATFKVWIRITSSNRDKLVGLLNTQAEARFTAKSVTDAILISIEAMQKDPDSDGLGVYVPVDDSDAGSKDYEFRPCKFGVDNGELVEVVEGLEEGEEVYTKLPVKTHKERKAEEE